MPFRKTKTFLTFSSFISFFNYYKFYFFPLLILLLAPFLFYLDHWIDFFHTNELQDLQIEIDSLKEAQSEKLVDLKQQLQNTEHQNKIYQACIVVGFILILVYFFPPSFPPSFLPSGALESSSPPDILEELAKFQSQPFVQDFQHNEIK